METPSHITPASHILPSILSWQLSPSFPAYPWRVQPATPNVPFFTIPSTPPQFLPAHSYPYTFAPMPAIAGPPFSINPAAAGAIQHVPASIAYAGVAVPQVTGLHAELVVSSTGSGQSRNPEIVPPTNAGMIPAVIHSFPQSETLAAVPSHPVSVVVDPRGGDMGGVTHDHIVDHNSWPVVDSWGPPGRISNRMNRAENWLTYDSTPSSLGSTPSPTHQLISSISTTSHGRHDGNENRGTMAATSSRLMGSPSSVTSPPSLPYFFPSNTGATTESSDDEVSDYISSPLNWSTTTNGNTSVNSSSLGDSPNTGTPSAGSGDEGIQNSPASQQRAMGSALQTLADAAAFLSTSSPQSEGSSSAEDDMIAPSNDGYHQRQIHEGAANIIVITDSDSFINGTSSSSMLTPSNHQSNQLPGNRHGNIVNIPAQGYAPTVLSNYHHHHQPSGLEDLPVFVPVIHPTVESHDQQAPPPPQAQAPPVPSQILYTPQDGGMVLPPQQQVAEIPPLIHVAQGSRNIIPVSDPWPAAIVEPVPGPAAYIHSRPIVPAAGGFWEEVMVSQLLFN